MVLEFAEVVAGAALLDWRVRVSEKVVWRLASLLISDLTVVRASASQRSLIDLGRRLHMLYAAEDSYQYVLGAQHLPLRRARLASQLADLERRRTEIGQGFRLSPSQVSALVDDCSPSCWESRDLTLLREHLSAARSAV